MPQSYNDIQSLLQSDSSVPDVQGTKTSSAYGSYQKVQNALSDNGSSEDLGASVVSAMDLANKQAIEREYGEGIGFGQGLRNVLSSVQGLAGKVGLKDPSLGGILPTDAQNKAAMINTDAAYASNPAYGFGKVAGETAGIIPFTEAGGALISPAVEAASGLPVIGGVTDFLAGRLGQVGVDQAGNVVRSGNPLLNLMSIGSGKTIGGALRGGTAAALTSSTSDLPLSTQVKNGMLTGAVAEPVLAGVSALGKASIAPFQSDESYAANKLLQAFGRDQIAPENVINKLNASGQNATVADVGGANTLALTGAMANKPGAAQDSITSLLNARQEEQQKRLLDAANTGLNLGSGISSSKAIDDLITQRAQAASPLYEKAFSSDPVASDKIDEFWQNPTLQSGIKKGLAIQRMESTGTNIPYQPYSKVMSGWNGDYETGEPNFSEAPNVQLLDAAKKGLDKIIQTDMDPITGKLTTDEGRATQGFKNRFLSAIDEAYPDYAAARSAFAGPSASIDAIRQGSNFMRNGAEANVGELSKMSDSDKAFFRIGVGQAVSDMINGTPETANAANKIFNTTTKKNALQSVFPDEDSYNQFAKTVNEENQFYKTKNATLGGSPTAARLAALQGAEESPVSIGDIANIAQGNIGKAAFNVANKAKGSFSTLTPERSSYIANILVNPDKQEAISQLQQLMASKGQPNPMMQFLGSLAESTRVPASIAALNSGPYAAKKSNNSNPQ